MDRLLYFFEFMIFTAVANVKYIFSHFFYSSVSDHSCFEISMGWKMWDLCIYRWSLNWKIIMSCNVMQNRTTFTIYWNDFIYNIFCITLIWIVWLGVFFVAKSIQNIISILHFCFKLVFWFYQGDSLLFEYY